MRLSILVGILSVILALTSFIFIEAETQFRVLTIEEAAEERCENNPGIITRRPYEFCFPHHTIEFTIEALNKHDPAESKLSQIWQLNWELEWEPEEDEAQPESQDQIVVTGRRLTPPTGGIINTQPAFYDYYIYEAWGAGELQAKRPKVIKQDAFEAPKRRTVSLGRRDGAEMFWNNAMFEHVEGSVNICYQYRGRLFFDWYTAQIDLHFNTESAPPAVLGRDEEGRIKVIQQSIYPVGVSRVYHQALKRRLFFPAACNPAKADLYFDDMPSMPASAVPGFEPATKPVYEVEKIVRTSVAERLWSFADLPNYQSSGKLSLLARYISAENETDADE